MKNADYKSQINELVKAHQDGQAGAADQAFILLTENDWTQKKKWRHVMLTGEHINDVESVYIDAFMNALEKFDPERGDFVHYVNRSVENRVRNLGLARKKRMERHAYESSWQHDESVPFWDAMQADFADCEIPTPEEIVTEELTKEDKMQFIPVIAQDMIGRMTDSELAIVSAYMLAGSYREAAKAVGTNAMKVMRTLDKVKKHYDELRFGDVHRFFTVNTIKSRA